MVNHVYILFNPLIVDFFSSTWLVDVLTWSCSWRFEVWKLPAPSWKRSTRSVSSRSEYDWTNYRPLARKWRCVIASLVWCNRAACWPPSKLNSLNRTGPTNIELIIPSSQKASWWIIHCSGWGVRVEHVPGTSCICAHCFRQPSNSFITRRTISLNASWIGGADGHEIYQINIWNIQSGYHLPVLPVDIAGFFVLFFTQGSFETWFFSHTYTLLQVLPRDSVFCHSSFQRLFKILFFF